jgi:hypothetical protein
MTTATLNPSQLVGSGRAARLLEVSPQGLGYLVHTGKLHCTLIDGLRFYDRAEVERLAAERSTTR